MAIQHVDFVSRPAAVGGYNSKWAPDSTAFVRFTSAYTGDSAASTTSPLWPVPAQPTGDLAQWIWLASPPDTDFSAGVIRQFELVQLAMFTTPLLALDTVDAVVYVMADNAFDITLQFRAPTGGLLGASILSPIFPLPDNPLPINTPQTDLPYGWQNIYIFKFSDVFSTVEGIVTPSNIDMDFRGRVSNYLPGSADPASNTAGLMFRVDAIGG